jgi:hypothetical protein
MLVIAAMEILQHLTIVLISALNVKEAGKEFGVTIRRTVSVKVMINGALSSSTSTIITSVKPVLSLSLGARNVSKSHLCMINFTSK